ncbi:hypothetical protein [Limosilactobacillus fermentum]
MKVFKEIVVITNSASNEFSKLFVNFSKAVFGTQKNTKPTYYQNAKQIDKEHIASDFQKIGRDMYKALKKYEVKHGY